MKLLFIASDRLEFQGILPHCRDVQPLVAPVDWARRAMLGDYEVALAANGVGVDRSAAAVDALAPVFHPDALVSIGFCGALDPALTLSGTVVASAVLSGDRRFTAQLPAQAPPHRAGPVLCHPRIAGTAAEKAALRKTGACAVEMEGAGVALRADTLGLPFFCIKSVTDLAGETLEIDFNASLRSDGHFDTIKVLQSSLRRPLVRLPELFRLRARSIQAARSMGDFIADCRF